MLQLRQGLLQGRFIDVLAIVPSILYQMQIFWRGFERGIRRLLSVPVLAKLGLPTRLPDHVRSRTSADGVGSRQSRGQLERGKTDR